MNENDFQDDDLERRALFGFDFAGPRQGWFESLFEDYSLYPNLNILKKETRDLLYRKNLLQQLVPIFARELTITTIVNKLIHFDIFAQSKDTPGTIEAMAKIIIDDSETKKTLESRIQENEAELSKNDKRKFPLGRYFCGLTYSIFNRTHQGAQKPRFKDSDAKIEGQLIAVEGILNHVDAVAEFDPAMGARFKGSGISWILSDFPFFSMTPKNNLYKGDVLALSMDKEFEEIISGIKQSPPFSAAVGWYPYVVVFGKYRAALDPHFAGIKVIEWSWMRFRRPKDANAVATILPDFLGKAEPYKNGYKDVWLDVNEYRHLLLFLSAIQIIYATQNIGYDVARDDIRKLAEQVITMLKKLQKPMPVELESFFGKLT